MDIEKAGEFILANARPLELALYELYFGNGSPEKVISELAKFQNEDGGFGHGLEADNWNPYSNPIATNDALLTLNQINALYDKDPSEELKKMLDGMVKYLSSHDSFDEEKKRWLFAIESSKAFPHAVWWEKNDTDGINGFNPSVSLAAFMVSFGGGDEIYEDIVREAFAELDAAEASGDGLKCYIVSYLMLKNSGIEDVIDLAAAKEQLGRKLEQTICPDIEKYGVEYVFGPSEFFFTDDLDEFLSDKLRSLIAAEKAVLGKLQKDDGGFDITWKWYTPYDAEYEQARKWWRAKITLCRMMYAGR